MGILAFPSTAITDATVVGRSVLTALDPEAAQEAIGLGPSGNALMSTLTLDTGPDLYEFIQEVASFQLGLDSQFVITCADNNFNLSAAGITFISNGIVGQSLNITLNEQNSSITLGELSQFFIGTIGPGLTSIAIGDDYITMVSGEDACTNSLDSAGKINFNSTTNSVRVNDKRIATQPFSLAMAIALG